MKRIFAVFMVILSAALVTACKPALEKREPNLSELRDVVMTGGDERASITLISGKREQPYEIDGTVSGQTTDYTVITVKGSFPCEPSYRLYAGGQEHEGVLVKHPFKDSYSAEIAVRTDGEASVMLSSGDYARSYALSSVITEDMITPGEALEIAEARLKDKISGMSEDGRLMAEIYLRLIENPISGDGGYYWYVAFVPERYVSYAVLIHPATREIVAVKE
jgi:hypothetical protein